MKIVVLGGGNSPERDISLRSAGAVADALKAGGFEVIESDPANGLQLPEGSDFMVFPILHGEGGEDGVIQAELEKRNIPYLGTSSAASALCFNKTKTREALLEAGLPVARGAEVNKTTYQQHDITKKPHVLKVARGGSSIGTYIVRNPEQIDSKKVEDVFGLDDIAVIEELVQGTEITVPILDNKALPVFEVIPPDGQEFDYKNKYNGKTQELCPPISISEETCLHAQQLAEKVHSTLGARHLSRIDMIIQPNGQPVVLELNTIPGMTDQSFYPKSAKVSGLDMVQLVSSFVNLVKRDYNLN